MDSRSIEEIVVGWASDGRLADATKRATAEWPLAKMNEALAVAAAYMVLITVLSIVMKSTYGPDEAQTPKGLTVAQKFRREPVLLLQAVYNPTQVALCGWMIYEARTPL